MATFTAINGFLDDVAQDIQRISDAYGATSAWRDHMVSSIARVQSFKPHYEYEEIVLYFKDPLVLVHVDRVLAPRQNATVN